MATVRIGDAETQAIVAGGLDSEIVCDLSRTAASRDLMSLAVPGARAVVMIAGSEFTGHVRVTSPDDYVTTVEF